MAFQNTLKLPIKFSGIGVHSGKVVNVTLKPAQPNHGIVFKRIDHNANNIIEAKYSNVVDTKLCTVISNPSGLKVSTIEHLMSALYGMNIDNALIEIDSSEMAILDGSSSPFVAMIKKVGILSQNVARTYIKILQEVFVGDEYSWVRLKPSALTSYKCSIDFSHPSIGYQEAIFIESKSEYGHDISRARTFGFSKEIEMLKGIGLAKGGSLENAIGVGENGILNPEGLRYSNEFACHKLLDLIGDLYLAGHKIIGEIEGYKCGHSLNNNVLKQLFNSWNNYTLVELAKPSKTLKSAIG